MNGVTMTDMAIAEEVIDAMREDRIELAFRPIRSSLDCEAELYRECVSRVLLRDGGSVAVDRFIDPIKRFGLACLFDRYVVRRVTSLLRSMPEVCLGVQISGSSTAIGIVWEPMFIELSHAPDLAARLVIEIDEAASISPRLGGRFGCRLRQLGCRLAIDHFGEWGGPQGLMGFPEPDVVKIDASMFRTMDSSESRAGSLKRLVARTSDRGQDAVIVGIDSRRDLESAVLAGARWVQGPWFD
jgi:EAL domain-containing protein (putative c-di-GMP-specific phosphodiesterase class I)